MVVLDVGIRTTKILIIWRKKIMGDIKYPNKGGTKIMPPKEKEEKSKGGK